MSYLGNISTSQIPQLDHKHAFHLHNSQFFLSRYSLDRTNHLHLDTFSNTSLTRQVCCGWLIFNSQTRRQQLLQLVHFPVCNQLEWVVVGLNLTGQMKGNKTNECVIKYSKHVIQRWGNILFISFLAISSLSSFIVRFTFSHFFADVIVVAVAVVQSKVEVKVHF